MVYMIYKRLQALVWGNLPDVLAASFIFIEAILVRYWFASQRMLMPAGDPFNFLQGAQTLPNGLYSTVEKRPPGYSFFIAVVDSIVNEPFTSAVIIAVAAGAGALLVLYIIGRSLDFSRELLLVLLTLASFEPLLVIMGVRPLSQSLFFFILTLAVLFVIKIRGSWPWIIGTGITIGLLALTRIEGVPIAFGLVLLTRLRIKWHVVAKVVLAIVITLIPWFIVVTRSTGAPWRLPGSQAYLEETSSGARGTSDPLIVVRGMIDIVKESWVLPWAVPLSYEEHPEDIKRSAFIDVIMRLDWWVGVFALLGLGWFAIRQPRKFIPTIFAFGTLLFIAAWYRPSGKYAAPVVGLWFFVAAGGMTGITYAFRRYRSAMEILLIVLILTASFDLAPAWASISLARVSKGNGNGYTLFQTIKNLRKQSGLVAFGPKVLMAEPYLGRFGSTHHPPQRSIMLFQSYANEDVDGWISILRDNDVTYLVQYDDVRMVDLVEELQRIDAIAETTIRKSITGGENIVEQTALHKLRW